MELQQPDYVQSSSGDDYGSGLSPKCPSTVTKVCILRMWEYLYAGNT